MSQPIEPLYPVQVRETIGEGLCPPEIVHGQESVVRLGVPDPVPRQLPGERLMPVDVNLDLQREPGVATGTSCSSSMSSGVLRPCRCARGRLLTSVPCARSLAVDDIGIVVSAFDVDREGRFFMIHGGRGRDSVPVSVVMNWPRLVRPR